MVRHRISARVAILVTSRAPNGASAPPGAPNACRSANSINSCSVVTVGYPDCRARIGVSSPEIFAHGDFPKTEAPRLNQTKSGFKRFTRDKMAVRALL